MRLNLLIFCGILCQVFIGNIAEQEIIRKSSDLLLRQKRVISHIPGEDKKVPVQSALFIVHLKYKNRISCVGTILSERIVITVASCVPYERSEYQIFSRSKLSDRGIPHNISHIERYFGLRQPDRSVDGIALLTVDPPFVFGYNIRKIELHTEPLLADTIGHVFGWGFNCRSQERGTEIPKYLRSIEVPIMNHRECVNIYRPHNILISDKDICTFHRDRHCGHNDGGAPLVVEGELVGLHLFAGPNTMSQMNPEYPDVFVLLQHPYYSNWIRMRL